MTVDTLSDARLLADAGLDRMGRTKVDPDPRLVDDADMSYLTNVIGRQTRDLVIIHAVAKFHNDIIDLQGAWLRLNAELQSSRATIDGLRTELERVNDRRGAENMAWANIYLGLEAHLMDRVNMKDDASPQTYLDIMRGDIENHAREAEQIYAATQHRSSAAMEYGNRQFARAESAEASLTTARADGIGPCPTTFPCERLTNMAKAHSSARKAGLAEGVYGAIAYHNAALTALGVPGHARERAVHMKAIAAIRALATPEQPEKPE